MNWKQVIFQRVLNLPPPKSGSSTSKTPPTGVVPPQAGSVGTPTAVPWQIASEGRSAHTWRQILRIAALAVLVLFAWIGVRETFLNGKPTSTTTLPASGTFDTETASGVATRFATTALTWNEDTTDLHATTVGLDYVYGPDGLGWNGRGRQDVVAAIPSGVKVGDDGKHANVTVLVQVRSFTRANPDAEWISSADQWAVVEVPVMVVGGRMVATGAPCPVGQEKPRDPGERIVAELDSELSKETQSSAEAFFAAYGDGDVTAVEAPSAKVVAPEDPWVLSALVGWQVYAGSGETRMATAEVTWAVPDQPQTYTVTYEVTMTLVSGGGADRWQVSDVATGSTVGLN